MTSQNPCRYCENRHKGCHAHCEVYLTWAKELRQAKAKARKDNDSTAVRIDAYYKILNDIRRKNKR